MTMAAARPWSAWGRAGEVAVLIGLLLALWQVLHHVAGDVAMSAPIETVRYAFSLIVSGEILPHVSTTGKAFAGALLIATIGGTVIGATLGLHRLAGEVAEPIMVSLYSIPKVILYPIILLFFGIGLGAEVAFGALHGIVPVVLFTMNAVRNIKPVYIRAARAFRLSHWVTMRTVLLPAALPEIFTGVRVGFSVAFLGTIVSEMFGSKRGLGFLLMNALGVNDVKMIMSLALLMVIFAAATNSILLAVEHRLHHRA